MGPIPSLSGQQSVAPLTKQLRKEDHQEIGLTNRDSSQERVASAKEANSRVSDTKGSESRNLLAQSSTSDNTSPASNGRRGSLLDISV